MLNKTRVSLLIALLVFAATVIVYMQGALTRPEYYLYDAQTRMFRADKVADKRIKVVLVDEAALKSMSEIAGRWPWPRAIWSDLLEFLSMGGAKAVLFDILFLERQDKFNDQALISATRDFGHAYHSMMITHEPADTATHGQPAFLDRFALKQIHGAVPPPAGLESNDFALPIRGLAEAAQGVAVVEFSPDSDNGFRRSNPLREYQGHYFPVLGMVPFITPDTPIEIGTRSISMAGHTIPLDGNGNALINMYGLDKVESYSISGLFASLQQIRRGDVENLLVNPEDFRDSIVFIGASAAGTADLKAIPLGKGAPGVYLHAFMASNFLLDDFMSPPDKRITYASIFMGAFLTCLAVMFTQRLSARILLPMAMLLAYIGFALFSFHLNMQVEMAPFLFATFSTGFLSFGYLTFTEGMEKRRVSHLFTQYVSKDVLNEVMNNYKEYLGSSAGQKVEISILFSDIRGFTSMSETTPPEKVVEMLNVHFSVMADIILKHNGTIDKYIGDAIMAFWGAPMKTDNHAEQAVLAGKEMLEGLKEVNRILKERGFKHEINIGIGINTGIATIGNIGSEIKKNYTVVGDAVNLASRLESITKEQHVPLLFSEYTYAAIKGKIPCRQVGRVTVKGREQAVEIYTSDAEPT